MTGRIPWPEQLIPTSLLSVQTTQISEPLFITISADCMPDLAVPRPPLIDARLAVKDIFRALFMAMTPETAEAEFASHGTGREYKTWQVDATLSRCLDVTDQHTLGELGLSQEVLPESPYFPWQVLGFLAQAAKIEAIIWRSFRGPDSDKNKNVGVFMILADSCIKNPRALRQGCS